MAIAILKSNEAEILGAETVSDLFGFVGGMTSRLWAADKLISASRSATSNTGCRWLMVQVQHHYKSIVKHADVEKRFQQHLAELQETEAR